MNIDPELVLKTATTAAKLPDGFDLKISTDGAGAGLYDREATTYRLKTGLVLTYNFEVDHGTLAATPLPRTLLTSLAAQAGDNIGTRLRDVAFRIVADAAGITVEDAKLGIAERIAAKRAQR